MAVFRIRDCQFPVSCWEFCASAFILNVIRSSVVADLFVDHKSRKLLLMLSLYLTFPFFLAAASSAQTEDYSKRQQNIIASFLVLYMDTRHEPQVTKSSEESVYTYNHHGPYINTSKHTHKQDSTALPVNDKSMHCPLCSGPMSLITLKRTKMGRPRKYFQCATHGCIGFVWEHKKGAEEHRDPSFRETTEGPSRHRSSPAEENIHLESHESFIHPSARDGNLAANLPTNETNTLSTLERYFLQLGYVSTKAVSLVTSILSPTKPPSAGTVRVIWTCVRLFIINTNLSSMESLF